MALSKKYIKSRGTFKVKLGLPKDAVQSGSEVRLMGDFNDWQWDNAPVLTPASNTLKVEVELKAGTKYQYRFLTDSAAWLNDWNADAYVPTAIGLEENCVLDLVAIPEVIETSAKLKKATSKKSPAPVATAKKATAKKATAKKATKKVAVKKAPVKNVTTKAVKAKSAKDDLTKIEGIGPKMAKVLAENGITTYQQLSKKSVASLKTILKAAGKRFERFDPANWPKEAKKMS